MKLGKHERAMLEEIELSTKDIFVGFLCSAGSARVMYHRAYEHKKERLKKSQQKAALKQARMRALKRLEKKNLIKLIPGDKDCQVVTTAQGQAWVGLDLITRSRKNYKNNPWDKQWTLVMFDMPTSHTNQRISLVRILRRIGFVQTQFSNYVFPYDVPELENFLTHNPKIGEYCQIFRGKFRGDDSNLRNKFDLS